jgi:hypothetical protein
MVIVKKPLNEAQGTLLRWSDLVDKLTAACQGKNIPLKKLQIWDRRNSAFHVNMEGLAALDTRGAMLLFSKGKADSICFGQSNTEEILEEDGIKGVIQAFSIRLSNNLSCRIVI